MRRGLWLIPLLFFSFLAQVPLPAHAVSSLEHWSVSSSVASRSSCTSQSLSMSNGNLLVSTVFWDSSFGSITFTASDTLGNIYTQAGTTVTYLSGVNLYVAVFYATQTHTTGANAMTISGSSNADFASSCSFYDVTGLPTNALSNFGTGLCTTGNVQCGSVFSTASTDFGSGAYFAVAQVAARNANFEPTSGTPGANFAFLTTGGGNNGCLADGTQCSEYSLSGLTPPTTFPGTMSGNSIYGVIGAVFGNPATNVVVYTVTACNFSQLQCWWYPFFFMGLYSGFILMVGTWLRTSPRGKTHLFLSAVTFGSLVAVIFGIMTIAFPLMMLVLNTIIALRLRG